MSELRTDMFLDTSTYSKVYIETTHNRNISIVQCTPSFDSSLGTVDQAKRPEDRGTEVRFPGKATVLSHFISTPFRSSLGHARRPMQLIQEAVSTGGEREGEAYHSLPPKAAKLCLHSHIRPHGTVNEVSTGTSPLPLPLPSGVTARQRTQQTTRTDYECTGCERDGTASTEARRHTTLI